MASSSSSSSAALMMMTVALVVLTIMPLAQGTISCNQVTSKLTGCLPYIQKGGSPTPACCAGVRSVNAAATTTPDRQAVCNCLKNLLGRGFNLGNAAGLPGKCGVAVPYPISPSTNCAKVR